jgi:chromosomal replication initiation ATPase DnaA
MKTAWEEAAEILLQEDLFALRDAGLVVVSRADWLRYSGDEAPIPAGKHVPIDIIRTCERAVLSHHKVAREELISRSRKPPLPQLRALVCLLARTLTQDKISWPTLGRYYHRKHDTLLVVAEGYLLRARSRNDNTMQVLLDELRRTLG